MFSTPTYKRLILIVTWVFLTVASATAQEAFVVMEGQTGKLFVENHPGSSYSWVIYNEQTFTTEAAQPSEISFPNGNNQASVNVTWSKAGTYYVTATEIDAIGCTNTKVVIVDVKPGLIADAGNDTIVGGCTTIVADASGSQGLDLTYSWESKTGTFENPTAQVTNYTPDGPGQQELILTVTNSVGKSKSDTCVVTVLPLPEIVMDAPETIDSGMNAILDASASTGAGSLTFNWTTLDGTIEGVNDEPNLEISSAGTYTLTIADTSGCMATQDVFVQPVLHAPVAYGDFATTSSQDPINIAVLTNDVDIDNNLDTSSVTILLQPSYGDVTVLPDGTINYIPTQPYEGNDQFTYQVCDMTNLCDSAVVLINVGKGPFLVSEAFSPNGDGFNDTFRIFSIEKYPGTTLTVYNRWENKVYESKDYKNDWDGKCNTGLMSSNRLLPVGTYYYVMTLGGTHKTYKGFVYIGY